MRWRQHGAITAVVFSMGVGGSCNGCRNDTAPDARADASAGGGAPGGGSGGGGLVGGASGTGAGGSGGTGNVLVDAGDAGIWQAAGDPGWQNLTWAPNGCADEALIPANAAPPLVWKPCGASLPGCELLERTWTKWMPLQAAQFHKTATGHLFAMHFQYSPVDSESSAEQRKALYGESGQPLAVWRTSKSCGGLLLQPTDKHVCFALGNGTANTKQALLSLSAPNAAPLSVYESGATLALSCTEEILQSALGSALFIRDLASGQEFPLLGPSGTATLLDGRLYGEFALLPRATSGGIVDALIWKRPNTMEKLVDVSSGMIYDIRTDGQTLAWILTGSNDYLERSPGKLFTSPFASAASGVKPTERRVVPATSVVPAFKRIGDGHYALIEQPLPATNPDRFLHVYRLSDARHWQVSLPSTLVPADIIHLDSNVVWLLVTTKNGPFVGVVRQSLAELGPGD